MNIVILFGTESGNAELVADDLSDALDDLHVDVRDMNEFDPAEIDTGDLYLVICSTYGDGELPSGAVPFHDALAASKPDLSNLRYAMFGLGDRSYEETYSLGSEIIDRQLTSLGATRVGEYGRHDANGRESASQAALGWLEGIRDFMSAELGAGIAS